MRIVGKNLDVMKAKERILNFLDSRVCCSYNQVMFVKEVFPILSYIEYKPHLPGLPRYYENGYFLH